MKYRMIGNLTVTIGVSIAITSLFAIHSILLLLGGVAIAVAGAFIGAYIPKEER